MANAKHTIHVDQLDMVVRSVYDVTMWTSNPNGGVVLHLDDARIVLSAEVLADIDQARAEAAADARSDAGEGF